MAINWKYEEFARGRQGRVGKIRLFSVSYSLTRHEDGKMYVLGTTLPMKIEDRFETEGEAMEYAEEAVRRFVTHLTRHMEQEECG